MKFIHLSDLHLGKRVNEFSMTEDQEYILKQILKIADVERPEAVVIAGDIYDKPLPPAEAVTLFDWFLNALAKRNISVLAISGNHDSAERVAFGSGLMQKSGIYISPVYGPDIAPVRLEDSFGAVNFYLLPFIRPAQIRSVFGDDDIKDYNSAVSRAVKALGIDPAERNVLVTHQFVTGASRSDSEEALSVGGSENVDADVFEAFDYTALGHLHRPQDIVKNRIRYCGSPLKYSFSEASQDKSVTVVNIAGKGEIEVKTLPLRPRHDLREIRGKYGELTLRTNYENTAADDYLHITLTDEEDQPNALERLRTVYPNIMKLDYDNARTRGYTDISGGAGEREKSPYEIFAEFYEKQNLRPMSDGQAKLVAELIQKIWEE